MSNEQTSPSSGGSPRQPTWVIALILVFIVIAYWRSTQREQPPVPADAGSNASSEHSSAPSNGSRTFKKSLPDENEPSLPELTPEYHENGTVGSRATQEKPSSTSSTDENVYRIEHQTIRDLNGKVVFKGTIDLKPTLDRIKHGESNRHKNDGTTFQNREGRLPKMPNGYYKEYVHPTPGESGPGPQRIIIGRDGEIWYTPDHYRTFKEVKPASSEASDN